MEICESAESSERMKILQVTQKNFATVGISATLSTRTYPLNGQILLDFALLGLYFICYLMYTFFEAKTFAEYTQSIYLSSMIALIIFVLLIIISNVKRLFDVIIDAENLVNSSESK